MSRLRRPLLRGSALLAGALVATAGTLATAREAQASTCCAYSGQLCCTKTTCGGSGCYTEYHYYGEVEQM